MENVPEPGPGKKPQRRTPTKPGASPRKPAPARKPAAKPAAARRPATPAPAKPATEPVVDETVEPEVVADPETVAGEASPSLLGFTVPKLSIPTIMLGRSRASTQPEPDAEPPAEPEPVVEAASDEPVAEAEAEPVAEAEPSAEPEAEPVTEPEPEAEPEAEPEPAPKTVAKKRRTAPETILRVESLTKRFDDKLAVNDVDLEVTAGSFYGIVGPNGAGKTTTLSMITGLLRPTAGTVIVHGADVWADPVVAKRNMGVLPDRLRLFDRLTGAQLLYYAGVLRGMDEETVRSRTADLAHAFGLEESLSRLVSDFSAGMTKKVALAAAMIHSPRLLVLDEPFESVDPVSAATVTEILQNYVAAGGTVLLSSHSMDLVQRICDYVAVIVNGSVLADGTMAAVRNGRTLEERFVELAGGRETVEGLEWLHSFSD